MLKYILVLIFTGASVSQCAKIKLTEKAPFTITEATFQNWVGGQPGVRGTNLRIGIEALNGVSIQHVYYKNRRHTPSIETINGKTYVVVNITESRSDHIHEITLSPKKRLDKKPEVKEELPFKLSINDAVIAYTDGAKTRYYKVTQIKKVDTVFYH